MTNKNTTVFSLFHLCTSIFGSAIFFCGLVYAESTVKINVSLTLYNTYSGTVSLLTPGYTTGGVTYLTSTGISLEVAASETSTREIVGDMMTSLSGDGVGSYTTTIDHYLTPTDGPKTITGMFFKGTEFLTPTPLSVFIDTTAPTIPLGLTPLLNETIYSTNVTFNRSPSSDAGVGVKEYYLYVSTSPTFTSPLVFTSSSTSVFVPSNVLPIGTLYRYVESVDHLGNSNVSFPLFFTHTLPAVEPEGAVNVLPPFLRPEQNQPLPPQPVSPPPSTETPPAQQPWRRFPRRLFRRPFDFRTTEVLSPEPSQDAQLPQPVGTSTDQGTSPTPSSSPDSSKKPRYPIISIGKPSPSKDTPKSILDQIKDKEIEHLSPDDIEKLKNELSESPTPIKDYLENVLPHQVEQTTHTSAESPEEVRKQLLQIYQQLPENPFHKGYLEQLQQHNVQIPFMILIFRLLILYYDVETYRKWRYYIRHKKVTKTGQNESSAV